MGRYGDAPLTWKNVDAPDFSGVARLMALGQQSFDNSLEGINKIIQGKESVDRKNWDQGRINNTNDVRAMLLAAQNPEALASSRPDITIAIQDKGAQIDAQALMGELDKRNTELQNRAVSDINYNNTITDNKEMSLRDQAAALIAQKKYDQAAPLIAQLTRNTAPLFQSITQGQERTEDRDLHRRQVLSTIANNQSSVALHNIQAQTSQLAALQHLENAAAERTKSGSESKIKAAEEALKVAAKDTHFSGGTLDTEEGWDTFTKAIKASGINQTQIDDILYNFSKRRQGGIQIGDDQAGGATQNIPMPVEAAVKAALGAGDAGFNWMGWSRKGDSGDNAYVDYVTKNAQKIVQEKAYLDQMKRNIIEATKPKEASPESGQAKAAINNLTTALVNRMLGNTLGNKPVPKTKNSTNELDDWYEKNTSVKINR